MWILKHTFFCLSNLFATFCKVLQTASNQDSEEIVPHFLKKIKYFNKKKLAIRCKMIIFNLLYFLTTARMNTFVSAWYISTATKRRKLKKIKEKLFTALMIWICVWWFAEVWNSDFDTIQKECQAGLKHCSFSK